MARYVKQHDPDEERRRFGIEIQASQCPGLLEFLAQLPYRAETPTIRAVFYQWFLKHEQEGTLEEALESALNGPGGALDGRRVVIKLDASHAPSRQRAGHSAKPAQRINAAPKTEATISRTTAAPRAVAPAPLPAAQTPLPVASTVVTQSALETVAASQTQVTAGTGQSGNAAPADDEPITQLQLDALMDLEKMLGI
jgi:hypothetical protein